MKQSSIQVPRPTFTVAEWHSIELKGRCLAVEDRALAVRFSSDSNSRLSVDELRDGLRITTRSWVGVVRFHDFEVHIVPKLVGENLGLVKLIDYAAGLDALDRLPAEHEIEGKGTSLFDLISLLLAEAIERVVGNGLLADYREIDETLPVVRGRILFQKQVLKQFGRIDRLECRFDERITDIVENRILLAALSMCASRVTHPTVALRIRRLLAIFSEVCELHELDLRLVRTSLVYDRMNDHYRESHGLAWLIFDGLGIDDIFSTGSQRCFAFLLDMNRLFEDFITRWLRQVLADSDFCVTPQRRDRTILWNGDLNRPYAAVIPDLVVESLNEPGNYMPIDAKYKLYDQRNMSNSDIYQSFLYAYAYGDNHHVMPNALVLYPASSPNGNSVRLHVRRKNGTVSAQLRAVPIHIPTTLEEARQSGKGAFAGELIALIKQAFL